MAQVSIARACALTGRSRATHYRRADPAGVVLGPLHGPHRPRRLPPCTLTDDERAAVLALLNSPAYRDLAIPQVWARELDEGRFWCSQSSMYRIARDAGQSRERRAQATHPPRVRPELVARGPSEVWSWDITALKGPRKGEWYKLYVVLDIFSRYVTGWLVADAEDAVVARDFLAGGGRQPDRPAHDPRRPGRLDDVETGVGNDDRSRGVSFPFTAPLLE